jgi:ribose/xylose/arabinose/galactoside ABC-type transport system permease subunit
MSAMSEQTIIDDMSKRRGRRDFKETFSEYGVLFALILIFVALSLISPAFLSVDNILNVLRQTSINGLLAMGVTFVILTKGIDLSVGSIVAFSGVIAASLAQDGSMPIFVVILLGLIAGVLIGLVNGLVVARWNVAPFIVTLGMMSAARGITFVYSDGRPIPGLSQQFQFIGNGTFLGIPIPVIILLVVFIICSLLLNRTKIGRHVYAVGGNEESALISGVNVKKVKIFVYSISGLLAGLAGVILTSRVTSGLPQAGQAYELDAIAAVVIGGTSLSGGKGRLWGTLVGALLIGILNNGLDLLSVSAYYQLIIKGLIIVIAVMADAKPNK